MAARLDSCWETDNTTDSAKEIRNQRSMKNVRNTSELQK